MPKKQLDQSIEIGQLRAVRPELVEAHMPGCASFGIGAASPGTPVVLHAAQLAEWEGDGAASAQPDRARIWLTWSAWSTGFMGSPSPRTCLG